MSDFFDEEAEVSSAGEDAQSDTEKTKDKKSKKKYAPSDSSEEEEDDEDKIREENKNFINDDDEDDGSGSDSGSDSEGEGQKKRRREDDDDMDADNLDEDDLDLIEENIGVKINRKKKFKRLQRVSDEDSDDNAPKDRIANDIFQGSDDDDDEKSRSSLPERQSAPVPAYQSDEEDEESDGENFIVDDEGKPIHTPKKKSKFAGDENVAAAVEIFGINFNFEEFEQYDNDVIDSDEGSEADDEYDELSDEDDEEAVARREARKKRKEKTKKPTRKTIYDVFEPSELIRGHLTEKDTVIRQTDIPERFQLRSIPVTATREDPEDGSTDDPILKKEAKWIYENAFLKPCISQQDTLDDLAEGEDRRGGYKSRDSHSHRDRVMKKIYNALDLMRNQKLEVPVIAFYRKEEVQPELKIHHLWTIYLYDGKFCQLESRKANFHARLKEFQNYQFKQLIDRNNLNAPLPEGVKLLENEEIDRVNEVTSAEQLQDCYKHFSLHHGRHLPFFHEFLKRKKTEDMRASRKVITRTVKVMRKVKRKKKKKDMKKRRVIDDDDDDEPTERRSRSKSRSKSPARSKGSKSRSNSPDRSKSRGSRSRSNSPAKSRGSRSRSNSPAKSRGSRSRSNSNSPAKSRGSRSRSNSPAKSRGSRSRSNSPAKSRGSRSNSPAKSRGSRSRSKSPARSKGSRSRSKSPARSKGSRSRSKSPARSKGSRSRSNSPAKSKGSRSRSNSPNKSRNSKSRSSSPVTAKIASPRTDKEKSKSPEPSNVNEMNNGDAGEASDGYHSDVGDAIDENEGNKSIATKSDKAKESSSEEEVETEVETEVEEVVEEENEPEVINKDSDELKKAFRRHEYDLLKKANIEDIASKFGLKSEQFGENVRDNYQRFEVDQYPEEPLVEAEKYITKWCSTNTAVLEAAIRMVGHQLCCEPLVRKTIREVYCERARICIKPTEKGAKLIDEQHSLYSLKFIKDKPVHDLQNDQFLKIRSAVDDKLVTLTFSDDIEGNTSGCYLDELKQLYYRDEFSRLVQDWNALRGRAVEFAYKKIVEDLKTELSDRLLNESKNHVKERSGAKLHDWIKVSPYNVGEFAEEDEDDWGTSNGFRALALAFVPDFSQASFAAIIDVDGDILEHKRFTHMLKRKDAYDERDAQGKEADLQMFRDLVMRRKPHVITVGGESKQALMIIEDLKEVMTNLEETEQFPKINVELIDNTMSELYSRSKKGESDFPDYPLLLRQAVSLARRIQDPLLEFSQLCNSDEEILNLRYNPLQDLLSPAELLDHLYIEFVNRTNEVGVDLNMAVAYPHKQNLVQFLCGFGPRKANHLIKQLKQNNHRLENRNQLVLTFHMGPKVYVNIAGFVKIDTSSLGDGETYIEVLDSTRIHPEAYDWARKMAVDALDCDDEDSNKPAEALEEILDCPEKLNELDLEAFAKELENQGFGMKSTTLYDIRHELNHRYKDFRTQFVSPTAEEIFNMLTKESPETLYVGKLVQCKVIRFIHRKPRGDQLDNANPVRNEESGLWKCPFCMKNDFQELSDVWNHFDAGDCPGQAIGIKVSLDNGIDGFINIKNLSDKPVTNPAERVKKFGLIHARVMKIDPERFSVDLTSRTSDLQDSNNTWRPNKDNYYDQEAEDKDMQHSQKKKEMKSKTYHKRVISHASFYNVDFKEAEKIMTTLEAGEAIIRPSSKGIDHLTVSWKITEGIVQHIDVIEFDKQNHFSLGKKLRIGTHEFEDLDEILARYITPLSLNIRQILDYKYYKESVMGNKEKAAEYLKKDKEKNPKAIPYIFSPIKALPGKFMLSYLPRHKVIHEHMTVLLDGIKFREKQFSSLANLLKWFKGNFRNVAQMGAATPGRMSSRTPYMGGTTPSVRDTPGAHSVMHGATTPYSIATPNTNYSQTPYSNYAQTPYTPSGQTPFMTPYATTPGPSTTPRYPANGNAGYNSNMPPQYPPPGAAPHRTPRGSSNSHHNGRNDQNDWTKAAEAWAKASRSTPRQSSGSRQRADGSARTPRYNADARYNPYDYEGGRATPRSVRSTPKTIHSPTAMSIGGDQTPLYDE